METPEQKAAEAPQMPETPAQPDKVVELGSLGKVVIDLNGGVALVQVSVGLPGELGVEAGAFARVDGAQLFLALVEEVKKKTPDGLDPIVDTVAKIIVDAIKAMK